MEKTKETITIVVEDKESVKQGMYEMFKKGVIIGIKSLDQNASIKEIDKLVDGTLKKEFEIIIIE